MSTNAQEDLKEKIEKALGFRVSSSGNDMAVTSSTTEHWMDTEEALELRDRVFQLINSQVNQTLDRLTAQTKTFERLTGEKPSGEFERCVPLEAIEKERRSV